MQLITAELQFPEGPVWLGQGRLLVVEIKRGTLALIDTESNSVDRIAELGGGPNGAALGPDAALYVCNNGGVTWSHARGLAIPGLPATTYTGGCIQKVQLDSRRIEVLYSHYEDHPLSAPNDIVFDDAGGFWFTDTGKNRARSRDHGAVYYAQPDGSHIDRMLYPLVTPNGIALSPDGRELYVAETSPGRVWAWHVAAPGQLRKAGRGPLGARLVHGFGGYQLLDSMAIDAEGRICVATLVTGAISVLQPDGRLIDQIIVPGEDPLVTNICFGGEGLRTGYVTSSGRGCLYALPWSCAGLRLPAGRSA
jgi:gluconolactonase